MKTNNSNLEILVCPIDKTPLNENLICEKGHKFQIIDGIYDFIGKDIETDRILETVAPFYENVWAPLGFLLTTGNTYSTILRNSSDFVQGNTLLDIGTGTGKIFDFARCNTCIGLDVSIKFLKILKQKRSNVVAIRGDARSLPIKSESIDGISSMFVLHMLENPALGLKEISRVLKNGGKCSIGVLVRGSVISSILGKWWKIDLKYQDYYISNLKDNGLEIIEYKTLGPWRIFKCKKSRHL